MDCTRARMIDSSVNSQKIHVEGLLHLRWHCDMPQNICLSIPSGLMYITSLSVDGCELYLTVKQLAYCVIQFLSFFIIHQDLYFGGFALKIEFVVFVYELIKITYSLYLVTVSSAGRYSGIFIVHDI